jgi:FkbM family methyltransferase
MVCDILSLLPIRPTITVVDVGAMSLGMDTDIYAPLLQAGVAKIIGFEPVQAECDKLNAISRGRHVYLPYAIGDGRRRTFNICAANMTSSLYEPNFPLISKFQGLTNVMAVVKREEIDTHRLDDLPQVRGADYLKLDVQGAELDVLKGAQQTLQEAVLVQTEVEFVPLYKDQPLFAEVDQHLRGQGFQFHRLLSISGRAFQPLVYNNNPNGPMSQQLWTDAVYVKDFMALEALAPEKLLKLAVVLDIVYHSWDLAHHVLASYDVKMGSSLAHSYLQRMVTPQAPTLSMPVAPVMA